MKLKQISFKIISMVMVFAMMFGISATTISAVEWTHDDHTHSNDKDKIHYVSIGDSMANGYGFDGYRQDTKVNYNFLTGEGVYGVDAYPLQFEKYLAEKYGYDVEHTKLAASAMLAEDLLYLLGGVETEFDDGWNGYSDYVGNVDTDVLKEHFQSAVTDADIISLGIGNASFGAFLTWNLTDYIGIMGEEGKINENLTLENGLALLESEEAKEIVLEAYAELRAAFVEFTGEAGVEFNLDAILDLIAYIVSSYLVSYEAVLDRIVELNPDVEIIIVGLMNTTYGIEITYGSEENRQTLEIGNIIGGMFDLLNSYTSGLPVAKQLAGEYADAKFYYAEQPNPEFICEAFDDLADANWQNIDDGRLDGQTVRRKNIDAYNSMLRGAIGGAFVMNLPNISISDVNNYVFRADDQYNVIADFTAQAAQYNGNNASSLPLVQRYINKTGDAYLEQAQSKAAEVFAFDISKEISIAIYIAIEDAVCQSVNATEITLDGLLGIAGDFFDVLGEMPEAIVPSNNPGPNTLKTELSDWFVGSKNGISMCKVYALFKVGNGMSVHPTPTGHDRIAESVISAYENGYTVQDKTLADVIDVAKLLADLAVEYHDEAYAYAYAELKANGVIAEVNAALDAAIEAVAAAHAEVEGFDVEAKLEETKALIVKELALTEATLHQIKVLVGYETITEDYLETLKDLLELLEGHLENVGAIATELGGIVLDEAIKAVNAAIAELEILVNELAEKAYEYILEKAPVIYEQFVNAVVENVKYYSHEAAKACYYWLLNNPETVIEFFETYGDDIVDFIAENHKIIFGVIGFVGANYGEEIVELVLDNADVIIPAVINWFEIHGDLVWDLIVVYFDAIVAYYDLGIDLDFSTIEGIQASFDKIFGLLGDLVDMIADGVYDYLEALGILENIQNELAKLEAFIRDTIKEHIEALKDYVAEKIEAIKAEIQAQIDALEEALKNAADELKAEIQAQIDALKVKLEALVNAEIENLEDAVEALEKLLKEGVKDLGEYIYGVITEFVDAAVRGEFTPTEDSYYVSVNGGNAYYAELLAEALANNLDVDSIKLGNTVWGNIDYDMLSKADLVTIGYDENELSAFAVEQLLAYIANYADADLRNSTNEYVGNVFAALQNWIDGNKLNLDMGQYENETLAGINGVIDEILAYDLIAGKELTEMNWAEYVGEENLSYVDELRAELKSQLLEAGVIETFTYTVDIVAYIYENAEELGIPATVLAIVPQSTAYEILGENAYYTVEVPVADAIVFAAESYLYGYVEFNVTYGKLIVDLYKINPEATVILLGHYNAYDVEFAIGDVAVDLSESYGYIAGISSVQPFAYALLSPNVSYVDISDAETVYESYVAEGLADGSLLEFVMMYLADSSITDVSEAGNVYIYEQIMNILTVGCEHVYDNACDAECNKCGEIREVPGHVYDNACDTSCNVCGEKRDVPAHVYVDGVCIYCGAKEKAEHVHEYDSCYDTVCKTCGEIREAEEHAYDDCTDTTCYKCKEVREAPGHEYDNCADTECNNCGYERKALNHVYSNACDADCNVCGESREAAAHVYSGCTDTDCNVCGDKREAGAHVVDDCADNICNVCGQNVATNGHKYGAWTVTVEATRKNAGEKTHTCEKCGKVETKTIAALGGIGGGAIAAIVIGSVVVAGAAGFAIYWFLIQKKTFAALVAAIKGVFGGNAAAGAAAPAAEAATAEAAEAAAEAPAAEAEAPASEEETK